MCMISSAEKYYLNGCMGGGFYRSTLFPKVDMHNRGLLCTVNGLSDVCSDRGDAAVRDVIVSDFNQSLFEIKPYIV